MEKVYNLHIIESMCRGKADKILRMVETFIATMPAAITEINHEFENRNIDNLKKVVHRIKPTLSFYGISSLDTAVKNIEQTEDARPDYTDIGFMIDQIVTTINSAVTDLKKEYQLPKYQ